MIIQTCLSNQSLTISPRVVSETKSSKFQDGWIQLFLMAVSLAVRACKLSIDLKGNFLVEDSRGFPSKSSNVNFLSRLPIFNTSFPLVLSRMKHNCELSKAFSIGWNSNMQFRWSLIYQDRIFLWIFPIHAWKYESRWQHFYLTRHPTTCTWWSVSSLLFYPGNTQLVLFW